MVEKPAIPIVNISSLLNGNEDVSVAKQIRAACIEHGFFYVSGHGVCESLQAELELLSQTFFELPEEEKMKIAMSLGGRTWRGFFPLGDELTSGKPDQKEGIYFGMQLDDEHPKVKTRTPLHGKNLFPQKPEKLGQVVLQYMEAVTKVGHAVLRGMALSLELPATYFESSITKDPFILFRIFHYPKQNTKTEMWGVGEHTDYGLLTILKQDNVGGLQVRSNNKWIDAPPIPNTFVCNIGDMLDRMTGGLYISTPHRVLNTSGKNRFSFPLFFDPNFDVHVKPIKHLKNEHVTQSDRWDNEDVYSFDGKYGDYLIQKVSRVFPSLFKNL